MRRAPIPSEFVRGPKTPRGRRIALTALVLTLGASGLVAAVVLPASATVTQVNCAGQDLQTAINGAVSGNTLAISGACSKVPSGADPSAFVISGKNLILQGSPGAVLKAGTRTGRVLTVAGNAIVTISALTVQGGATATEGGGILNSAGSTLTLQGVTVDQDSAGQAGGGVQNNGTMTVSNSTFTNNTAGTYSGAIDNSFSSTLTVTNSTFTQNVVNNAGLQGEGGGVSYNEGTATYTNITAVLNSSSWQAGGFINAGSLTLGSSIVSANTDTRGSPDCYRLAGTVTSGGYNLLGANCGGAIGNGTTDLVGNIPGLLSLTDNGGQTLTMSPAPGSPVIDVIPASVCTTFLGAGPADQRGVTRPQEAKCDIGAVEVAPNPATLSDSYSTHQDTALIKDVAHGVLANDATSTGGPLTATVVTSPAHGALGLNADGSFTYTPTSGFTGTDGFTYAAIDSRTKQSTPETAQITVTPLNVTPPDITGVTPNSGTAGTNVTIAGTSLSGVIGVAFGGVPAVVTSASPTSVTAVVPTIAATGRVTVTTTQGTGTSSGNFTVTPPTITKLTPASGATGSKVTITGTGLGGATQISFAGALTSPVTVAPTKITVTVPAGAVTGPVSVVTPHGSASSVGLFSVGPPTIASIAPISGAVGVTVTVMGTGFLGATAVTLNGVPATILTESATKITLKVPLLASTGKITVTTPEGSATSIGDFTLA